METKTVHQQLHIVFLPYMGQGHTLPLIDIAKLFSSRGVKCTILTTPQNVPLFSRPIQTSKSLGFEMELLVIKFPSTEAGLPEGVESTNSSTTKEMKEKFFKAVTLFEPQVEQILGHHRPHCLVADYLFHWATDVAAKFGIPRLSFHGSGYFPVCLATSVRLYQPHMKVSSDSESFIIPNLPNEIMTTKNRLPTYLKLGKTEFTKLINACTEADERCYGSIINSFYELEPDYADHYTKVLGKKSWHIGPVSLCNRETHDKSERGWEAESSVDEVHGCLNWLNSKKPNSVVYICFGSLANFSDCQLLEIALGLEASQQQFIWVVQKEKNNDEGWLPEEFEKKIKGTGLILRGWAPQLLILDHEAVGAFVTHCGWNSILEGVSAGVPMITWPVSAEQFFNEMLVTQILGTGLAVGSGKWESFEDECAKSEASVKSEAIEKTITRVMVGDEAGKMRIRAESLREQAKRAVGESGSSFSELSTLIEELRSFGS